MMAVSDNAFKVTPELAAIRAKRPKTGSVAAPSAAGSYKDYKRRRGTDFAAAAIATPAPTVEQEEDQPWYKDVGKGVLGLGNQVLRTVDMPRAALVSATRELADAFDPNEDSSFKDFRDQFNRRAGAGELLLQGPHFGIGEKGPLDEILGFGLDVVLDPLTYLTFGAAPAAKAALKGAAMPLAKNAAEEAADKAFRAAIKSGESKVLAKKLQDVATSRGYKATISDDGRGLASFGNEALDNLIVNVNLRGRGALTPKALTAAGVSDDLVSELRIPAMGRALGVGQAKIALPGTGGLANIAENLKGDIKFKFRTRSGPANKSRDLFVTNLAGERELFKEVANLMSPLGQRLGAAVALRTVNDSKGIVRTWAQDTNRVAGQLFKDKKITKFSPEVSRSFINDLETDVLSTEAHGAVRQLFDSIRDRLVAAGIEVRYRNNYVPHMITQDAFRLAGKNPEIQQFLTQNLLTKEGFQRVRNLEKDYIFFGVKLETGSIEEINGIFAARFKKNLFEDDINVIMPRYIQNASKALLRGEQAKALAEAGVARKIAQQTVRTPMDSSDPFAKQGASLIRSAERQIETARKAAKQSTEIATDTRRAAVQQARASLGAERVRLVAERRRIGNDLSALQRVAADSRKRLGIAERNLVAAEKNLELWRGRVATERGPKRRPLIAKKRAAEASFKEATRLRDVAQKKLDTIMSTPDLSPAFRKRYSGPVEVGLRQLRSEFDAAKTRLDDVTQKFDELDFNVTAPGGLSGAAERSFRAADNRLSMATMKRDNLIAVHDAAAEAHLFAVADSRFALDQLTRAVTELDAGVKALGPSPTVKPRTAVQRNVADKYRVQTQNVIDLLNRTDLTPEWAATTKLEAAAAQSDLDALMARDQIGLLEDMIKATKDSMFVTTTKPVATKGMTQVAAGLESPEWLAKMFEIDDAFKQLPAFAFWANKVLGVWKGYAIARPGFHVRNAYSGMYGMFLEAGVGSLGGAKDWSRYIGFVRKFPDEAVRTEKAVARFGAAKAKDLEDAWRAVNATGAGQIAGEMGKETFAGGSLNPLSNQFKLFNVSRKAGENVEDLIRGTHAYDVIRRGGDVDMAVDIVNKWQFNYSDITQFDRTMKLVNPFWIFFSRNIGLQAQSWVKSASRLNRSVVNFERNMGYGLPEEGQEPPEWFRREGAIRIGGGDNGEDSPYLFTDLPAVTWPGDLQTLLVSSERDLGEVGSMLSPFAKVPIELATGKSLFTGADIPTDEFVPLPIGLRQVVNIANLAPSGALERNADGEIMIRRDALNALVGLSPIAGQLERLFPGTDVGKENATRARVAAGVGIGYRLNDERAQRGEQYRLYLQQVEDAKRRASLGF